MSNPPYLPINIRTKLNVRQLAQRWVTLFPSRFSNLDEVINYIETLLNSEGGLKGKQEEKISKNLATMTEIIFKLPTTISGSEISKFENLYLKDSVVSMLSETIIKALPDMKQQSVITAKDYNSLTKILLAMAIDKYSYNPNAKKNTATGAGATSILASLEKIGLELDPETIKTHLVKSYNIHSDSMKPKPK